jgi:type II secretory pathway component PulM
MKQRLQEIGDRVDRLTLRERVLVFFAAATVLAFLWHSLFMEPLAQRQAETEEQVQQLRERIAEINRATGELAGARRLDPDAERRGRLALLQDEIADLDKRLQAVTGELIDPARMAVALEQMLERQPGLSLVSMQSLAPRPLLEERDVDGLGNVYRHGLQMEIEGSYLDILRYLRHEMGHVVNYAYRLYDREEWVRLFGSMTQPYEDEYRPEPFSRRFVVHLPGWYAQKHPDEDWAETFAVWLTPGLDWRAEYGAWPIAYAKLAYCSRTMKELVGRDPVVTNTELDEDVGDIEYSLDQYYGKTALTLGDLPPGLDGALRAIFEDLGAADGSPPNA